MFPSLFLISKMSSSFLKKIRKLSIGYKLMEKIRTSPPIESWINKGKTGGTPELRSARFFSKSFGKFYF